VRASTARAADCAADCAFTDGSADAPGDGPVPHAERSAAATAIPIARAAKRLNIAEHPICKNARFTDGEPTPRERDACSFASGRESPRDAAHIMLRRLCARDHAAVVSPASSLAFSHFCSSTTSFSMSPSRIALMFWKFWLMRWSVIRSCG
jgi:hypothetical protein